MLIKRNHKHIRRLLRYFLWPCIKAILSRMSVLTSPGIKWISKLHYGYIKTDMNCPYNNNDWGRNTYTRLNVGQQTKLTKRLHLESTISKENITADLITTSCSYSVKTYGNSTPFYFSRIVLSMKGACLLAYVSLCFSISSLFSVKFQLFSFCTVQYSMEPLYRHTKGNQIRQCV